MTISCGCDDWYPDPGDTYICDHSDYVETPAEGNRKRCKNCKQQIERGGLAVRFNRVKVPESDVELNIYGEEGEIPRAPWWICESCADVFFSLDALGYCFPITEIHKALEDYHQIAKGNEQ